MSSQEQFRSDLLVVLAELRRMLIEKNEAYGDSALNPVKIFSRGLDTSAAIRVRIDDKISRIVRGQEVAGEDTYDDWLGYLVLLQIAELRERRQAQQLSAGSLQPKQGEAYSAPVGVSGATGCFHWPVGSGVRLCAQEDDSPKLKEWGEPLDSDEPTKP